MACKITSLWWMSTVAIAAATREAPHATRGFFLTIPLAIGMAHGAYELLQWIERQRTSIRLITTFTAVLIPILSLSYFWFSYQYRFPIIYAKAWRAKDAQLAEYLVSTQTDYDRLIVDSRAGFLYTSYLFYTQFPPEQFQQTAVRTEPDSEGFMKITSFGNVLYKEIDWTKDTLLPRTAIVTLHELLPNSISSNHTIFYPRRPVVIADGQKIHQFPVEDIAYVVVFTHKL